MEIIVKKYNIKCSNHYRNNILFSEYFCNKNFREWLLSIGFDYVKSPEKTIPQIIFYSNIKNRCAFLAGLFDTDGSVSKSGVVRYTTSSLNLAEGIQLLLRSVGIISFFSSQNSRHYKITLSGLDTSIFKNKIPIRCQRKKKILSKYKHTGKTNHYEIPFGKDFVNIFKKSFNKHEGCTQGIKGKGLSSKYKKLAAALSDIQTGRNKMRWNILLQMKKVSEKEKFCLPEIIEKEIEGNFYYDKIVSIKQKSIVREMRDLEISENPSYTLKGYIVHNSQGQEYDHIILLFINQFGKNMLQRNLLYTALTRAKEKVIVIGHGSAIERAIENISVTRRNTILGERIKRCLDQKRQPSSCEQPLEQETRQEQTRERPLSEMENFFQSHIMRSSPDSGESALSNLPF